MRRLIEALPLVFGLVTIVFFISRLLPGDATTIFLSPTISPETIERLRTQFGLDRPVLDQYVRWIQAAVMGDLGVSFTHHEPVTTVIGRYFPNTALLAGAALLIEIVLGTLIALPAFFLHNSRAESLLAKGMLVVYTLPSFWIGMVLLLLFSYGLGWFPSSHMYSTGAGERSLSDLAAHLVLPAFTAAIPAAAGFARYVRSNVKEVMNQEFVLAAHSMGLSRKQIFRSYVFPNSLAPVIALIGVEIGLLLAGVLVTEMVFAWPGMGRLTVIAIGARDYPLVLGCTLVAGGVVIAGNLAADIANATLDPRIRHQA